MKERLIRSEKIPKCFLWTGTKFSGCRLLIQKISKEEEKKAGSGGGSGSELLFFNYTENEILPYLRLNNQNIGEKLQNKI